VSTPCRPFWENDKEDDAAIAKEFAFSIIILLLLLSPPGLIVVAVVELVYMTSSLAVIPRIDDEEDDSDDDDVQRSHVFRIKRREAQERLTSKAVIYMYERRGTTRRTRRCYHSPCFGMVW
jgi:hypothetical protein